MRLAPLRLLAALVLLSGTLSALAGCGKGGERALSHSGGSGSGGSGGSSPAGGVEAISTKNTTRLGGADPSSDAAAVARAVYPGLTPATRPQAVVLVDDRNWAGALTASVLASAPLGAPLLYSHGSSLPAVSEAALSAMHPLGSSALGGAHVIEIGSSPALAADEPARVLAGSEADPAALAASVQRLAAAVAGHSPRTVLAVASDAPRSLQMPAAALAAESGAPILFVTSSQVPEPTRAALAALRHPTIYVIAPRTLRASTYAQLTRLGTVVHVTGAAGAGEAGGGSGSTGGGEATGAGEGATAAEGLDPVQNAISVSRFSRGSFGWGIHEAGHGLVFVNVMRPLDAPAAAPLSAHGDYGPLLVLQDGASVPAPLTLYLSNIEPGYTAAVPPVREVYNHGWLIGDERAISAHAQAELDAVLEIAPRQPSAGEQSVLQAE
ncbi:MAG TPA: cell wall-binding repeat-containing protein [Solirubrobacteraceae bacterium]|jgi:hypothetical protein